MASLEPITTTLQEIDTQLYADSVEWCPFEGMQDILLCGTYQLLESEEQTTQSGQPQVRVGQLQVYRLHTPENNCPSLTQSHGIDMPGILDIKWARQPLSSAAVCGLVNAKGEFQLWKMGEESTDEQTYRNVSPECSAKVEIAECIGLSLDWAAPCEGTVARVVTSDSTGGLTVVEVGPTVATVSQWHAHDFEAWICAFDQWNKDVIYSGSDDCKLKVWDLRIGTTPVSTNSRFTMGVCSIQSSPQREHLIAVGSYDENLRVFDTRQMRHPVTSTALGGGVWRVKWDPFVARYILTASMHNGFHIVDSCKAEGESLPVAASYTKHTSLAYGVDWCRLKTTHTVARDTALPRTDDSDETCLSDRSAAQALVASCSFYDHSLQLWQWRDKE
ncbi:diphthine methyltransferase-like [Babylonia areolata]|uniref:diphthine methyltransferase-like n=1 Tax=Babylonia areolata TaxID=304850 RepID=UPI003FD1ADEB